MKIDDQEETLLVLLILHLLDFRKWTLSIKFQFLLKDFF